MYRLNLKILAVVGFVAIFIAVSPLIATARTSVFQQQIDSIKRFIPSLKSDSAIYEAYMALALYTNTAQTELSVKYCGKAYYYAKKRGRWKNVAYAASVMANGYIKIGDYISGIDSLKSAINISKKYGYKDNLIYAYGQLAKAYTALGRFDEAKFLYEQGLAINDRSTIMKLLKQRTDNGKYKFKTAGNETLIYSIILYMNYAEFFAGINRYDSAKAYVNMAIPILELCADSRAKHITVYMRLGEYELAQKHYTEAIKYYNTAKGVVKMYNNKSTMEFSLAGINYNIAHCYYLQHDFRKATEISEMVDCEKLDNANLIDYKVLRTDIFIQTKHYKEAYSIIKELLSEKSSMTNSQLLKVYNLCRAYYKSREEYANVLKYSDLVEELQDSLYTTNSASLVAQLSLLQYNKKKSELAHLDKANKLSEYNLMAGKRLQYLLIFVIIGLLAVAVIIYLSNKKRRKYLQEVKDINAQLNKTNMYLAGVNATKDKFFPIISDNLRQPITNMKNSLSYFDEHYFEMEDKEKLSYLDMLKSLSLETHLLLEDLLTWSRLQMGKIPFVPNNINLYLVVANVIDMESHYADFKQVSLENKIPDTEIVYGDMNMVSNIIRKIVNNGIKFSDTGSKVEIGICQSNRNGYKGLYVKDSGIGMSQEATAHIFNVGYNLSKKSGTVGEKGAGLGLILTKEFIDKNNGDVFVKSELGVGSEFDIFLPEGKPEITEDPGEETL